MVLDYKNVLNFLSLQEITAYKSEVEAAKDKLFKKTGAGSDYVGWVDYPNKISKDEITRILDAANEIRNNSEVLLIIGIGGSYLGAKSAISMLTKYIKRNDDLEVIFVGNSLSSTYTNEVLSYLQDKKFSINVISKSGSTTEPAIAFRLFKKLLQAKFGTDYYKRVYVTTTIGEGSLYDLAIANNYQTFSIPTDIGGRYSVLTPVGLLPIASCGIDINEILMGAKDAYDKFTKANYLDNDALLYAAIRNLLYKKGKLIEILVSYEPNLSFFGEWYKQLFGESEGKNLKGIFPSSVNYTTDLHSLGQYVQDGQRHLFETIINIKTPLKDIVIEKEENDFDGLNYLAGKTLDEVNKQALRGTLLAHVDGSVPNLILNIDKVSAYNYGYLVYFFMFSCGISGYLLGVNPFNQEGVEDYKKNMFALLGKNGYEDLKKKLEKK